MTSSTKPNVKNSCLGANVSRKKLKVGDRVRVSVNGEMLPGTISGFTVSPRVYWYSITLDDNRYVSRHEDDVEKAKDKEEDDDRAG